MSSTRRALNPWDIAKFQRIHAARPGRYVRVYSSDGFVPHAYKWRCEIEYVEYLDHYPHGTVRRGWTGAQRSHGYGPTVIVR